MAIQQASITRGGSVTRAPRPSNLAEVLDLILDKGIVIDAYVRVSVIGIELLTIDLRVVVASVDTYLRFAEAVNRLDLEQVANNLTLEDLQNKGAKSVGEKKGEGMLEKAKNKLTPGKDDSDDDGKKDGGVRDKVKSGAQKVRSGAQKAKQRVEGDDEDEDSDDENGGGIRGVVGKVANRGKWS